MATCMGCNEMHSIAALFFFVVTEPCFIIVWLFIIFIIVISIIIVVVMSVFVAGDYNKKEMNHSCRQNYICFFLLLLFDTFFQFCHIIGNLPTECNAVYICVKANCL